MKRGYVRLWRKTLDAGWLRNHELWAFWTWCLLKASHKEHKQIVGRQEVILQPGQFILGRKKASEELCISEQKVRTILHFLTKAGNLTIKSTNKFSLITVSNWHLYQSATEADQPTDQQTTNQRLTTNKNEKNGKKKNPTVDVSAEIHSLQSKYSSDLLSQAFEAISSTRKSKCMADSVKLRILQGWQKYPLDQVTVGIRVYLEKDCAAQGKGEKYLLGIIRNQNGEPGKEVSGESDPMVRKSSGSAALDEHYRSQGYKVIP